MKALGLGAGEGVIKKLLVTGVERESAFVFRHPLDVAEVGLKKKGLRLQEGGLLVEDIQLCASSGVEALLGQTQGFHALDHTGFLAVHGFLGLKKVRNRLLDFQDDFSDPIVVVDF